MILVIIEAPTVSSGWLRIKVITKTFACRYSHRVDRSPLFRRPRRTSGPHEAPFKTIWGFLGPVGVFGGWVSYLAHDLSMEAWRFFGLGHLSGAAWVVRGLLRCSR